MHKMVTLLVVLALAGGCGVSESKEVETVPVNEKALFAAGCFWGV